MKPSHSTIFRLIATFERKSYYFRNSVLCLCVLFGGTHEAVLAQNKTLSVRAKVALGEKRYNEAEKIYGQMLAQHPGSPELLTNMGIALQLQGKSTSAIHFFQLALKQRYIPHTFALLAVEKCRSRDLEGARPMVVKLIRDPLTDHRDLAIVAPCYLDMDDPIDAIIAYKAMRTVSAYRGDLAMIQLAKAYQQASRVFFQKLKVSPNSGSYIRAMQNARDGRTVDARGAFSYASQASRNFHGELNYEQAVAIWTKHPTDTAVLYQMSVLSGERSMQQIQMCGEMYPNSPYLEQLEADILADQGHQEEAVAKYEKLMTDHPDLPDLRYSLGMMYKKRLEWKKALDIFQQELTVDPTDERAAARVSEALLELQRYEELRTYLNPRVKTKDTPLWARLDLATAKQKLGDTEGAIQQLIAAEKEDPLQKATHYRLMRLYTMTGKSASAAREADLFRTNSSTVR